MAALPFVAVACQQKEQPYSPGEPDAEGCEMVYFPAQDFSEYAYLSPEAECSFEVTIARAKEGGAIVVPVELIANEEGIFQFGEVKFAAGEKETTFKVTFDKAEMGKKYTATFAVNDPKFVSKYLAEDNFVKFETMRVEWKYFTDPAGNKAKFTFDEMPFWEEIHTGYVKYYEVAGVRYCVTETEPVASPEGTAYGFWGTGDAEGDGEVSFEWYTGVSTADGYQPVLVNFCPVWYASNYGEIVYRWDWYEWWTIKKPQAALAGMTFPQFVSKYESSYPVSYYDGNGTFVFHCAYYNISAGNFTSDIDDVYLIADGFTRIDYSLEMASDYSYGGNLPLYFEAGADVAKIKVAAAQGELGGKALDALKSGIADGSVKSEEVDLAVLALALEFEATDMYTVAAVAFNEAGEVVNSADLTAFYVSAADQEEYAVKAAIGVEAVPERYGLDPYTTAAFWIAGEDLTEVHMAFVKAASVDENFLIELKADPKEKYALSEEEVAKINEKGGLYDYIDGLEPDTKYALVVWATNGSLNEIFSKTYTTEKLPYEWISLGKGTLTDDLMSLYGVPETTVPVEVFQEKNDNGLIMFKGHALPLVAAAFEVPESVMEAYEGGNWIDAEVVLDITDPNAVVWPEQNYGVCLSGADGFFYVESAAAGKLADGAITFPKKGLIIWLSDGGYSGNRNGKWQLTLPSAAPASVKPNFVEKRDGRVRDLKKVSAPAFAKEKIAIERDLHVADVKVVEIAPRQKANRFSALKAEKQNSIR